MARRRRAPGTAAATDTAAATTSAPSPDPGLSRAASDELARLFEAHARRVRLVCVSMLRDAHEADDALQQTFLSAYRSLLGGSVPRDAEAWLATIARNECRARIRDRMATPLADVEVETLVARDDPASAAAEREQLAVVLAAVGALPERERQAVVLQAFGGVSNAEVAARLGTTESAVESLLVRARAQLRARAWPVVAGARALALAPVSWVRALLFAPGGADVVAVAKVGTAMAVVGTLVAVGPSATSPRHQGGPPSAPAKARASLAPDVNGKTALTMAIEPARPARAPSAGRFRTPVRRARRVPRTLVRVAAVSAAAPAPSPPTDSAADDGAAAVAAGSSGDGDRGSSPGGPGTTSGPDGSSGSSSGPGSGSDSGSGSGSDTPGSDDGAGGTDGGTSGESPASGPGSSGGEASSGEGASSGTDSSGSGGSGADDPSSGGSSGSGSTSGSGDGSGSGSGSGSGGSGSSDDTTVTSTTSGGDDHR